MNYAHLLEAGMLVCFGFSWPMNVVKACKARSAKSTSLTFLLLIITGYIAGILAKVINHQFNYVLAVYVLNLLIVLTNLFVYFRNRSIDKKAEENIFNGIENEIKVVYAHEEQILVETGKKVDAKAYNIALLGGSYDSDICFDRLENEFTLDFWLINKSTFALSLRNAKEYFEKYVKDVNTDGIILHLGDEDKDLFKKNPSVFDLMYLEFIKVIKNCKKECRIAVVSLRNNENSALIGDMNNHIKAIAQSAQAEYVNLDSAGLWNPKAVQTSIDFAKSMGLKSKKSLYDIAQIIYSFALKNVKEEKEMNVAV